MDESQQSTIMIGQRGKLKRGEVVAILQKSEVKVFNTSDFEKVSK